MKPLCMAVLMATFVACFLFAPPPVSAGWGPYGTLICGAPGWQVLPLIVSDGAGGALITWADDRYGTYDIFAQRIDADGDRMWALDGIPVCTQPGDQYEVELVADDMGGAILTWHDSRASDRDIYAQRINAAGVPQWTADGVPICTETGDQEFPKIASDGAKGAIIAWQDFRTPGGGIYVQRIDEGGTVRWDPDGVPACNTSGDQYRPAVVSDGMNGAIVAWYDSRSGNNDIYAQRIDAGGSPQWTIDGVALCMAPDDQQVGNNFVWAATDEAGGAIVAWRDHRNGNWDIYAQRVTAAGAVAWTIDGEAVCEAGGDQDLPEVAADGSGGVFVTWQDERHADLDVYAQRIDASGNVQWTPDGVGICTVATDQYYPKVISDGFGGAIMMWRDTRYFEETTLIVAQRVDGAGSPLWDDQGILAAPDYGTQAVGFLIADGEGSAIATWYDYRNWEDYNIYATKIHPQAAPDYAPSILSVRDVPNDQGGKLSIQWEKSVLDEDPYTDITGYTVWRRLEAAGQQLSSVRPDTLGATWGGSARASEPGSHIFANGFAWEWLATVPAHYFDVYALTVQSLYDSIGTDPGWQYFMVSAQTWDPSIFFDSEIDSGYSVDNLAPAMPQSFAGEFTPSEGLVLSWEPNTENDLHHYELYRGASKTFTPNEDNLLVETTGTTATDGEWTPGSSCFYKLMAVDAHGNKSGCAGIGSLDITDADGETPRLAFALRQNHPNPFNPSTTIDFVVDRAGHASLEVYDISGALVRTLFSAHKTAGMHSEEWDGRDDQGKPVASGVYFYRLTSKDRQLTRKMILLK